MFCARFGAFALSRAQSDAGVESEAGIESEAVVDTQGRHPSSDHVRREYTSELGQASGLLDGWLVIFALWDEVAWI